MAEKLSRGRRISGRVSKMTGKLDRRTTLLGLIVLAVGGFLAFVAFQATTGPPFQARYELQVDVPSDSPVLRKGQAVRVGGKLAGLISAVEPNRETDATTVTANITKTEFRPLPEDTTAYVRVHSIVYETYLELRPGESETPLENGDTVAAAAGSGVDLLEVVQLFDEETRRDLSATVVNTGFGVAGRGTQLNEALNDLPQLSRRVKSQLEAATSEPGAVGELVEGAANTASGLRGERDDDVSGLVDSGEQTLDVAAAHRNQLGQTIDRLRPFEDQFLTSAPVAEALLDDLAATADGLEPALAEVNSLLPDLNRLFDQGDELSGETRRITAVADPTLDAARPVVFELFPTLTTLEPLNKNLSELKATVEPYKPEIAQAGQWLSDATGVGFPGGMASGAPAGRVVPVLTPYKCQNPLPKPDEAQEDSC